MKNTDTTKAHEKIQQDKLERVEKYNSNPNKCLVCQIKFSYKKRYNKFCGHSCAARNNNVGIKRFFGSVTANINNIRMNNNCLNCSNTTKNIKFCNNKCQHEMST